MADVKIEFMTNLSKKEIISYLTRIVVDLYDECVSTENINGVVFYKNNPLEDDAIFVSIEKSKVILSVNKNNKVFLDAMEKYIEKDRNLFFDPLGRHRYNNSRALIPSFSKDGGQTISEQFSEKRPRIIRKLFAAGLFDLGHRWRNVRKLCRENLKGFFLREKIYLERKN